MSAHFIATGCTVTFATTAFAAEVLDIRPCSPRRESINVSHQLTTDAHVFEPATLVDWGEFEMDIHFDPANIPPIDEPAETITIAFSSTPANSWSFTGFITAFRATAPLENKATGSVTVKISGVPTP